MLWAAAGRLRHDVQGRCVTITSGGKTSNVSAAAAVIAIVSTVVTAAIVLGLFVWAARKDGQYDRDLQRRLGIRRRTRL